MLLLAEDENGQHMTDKQLRDEVVTLVLAGHETTANALTWSWYLLSQHPEIEAKLHEEVDRVLGGRLPTLEDLHQLEYTNMIFKEALRLYPPIPSYGRQSLVPVELGGYTLPAQSIVLISPHVVHMDTRWWKNPERFEPERFSKENEKTDPQVRLFAIRRRPAHLHRQQLRGNGGCAAAGDHRAAVYACGLIPPIRKSVPEPTLTLRPRHSLTMRVEKRHVNTRQ